jgi:hypothetical protein
MASSGVDMHGDDLHDEIINTTMDSQAMQGTDVHHYSTTYDDIHHNTGVSGRYTGRYTYDGYFNDGTGLRNSSYYHHGSRRGGMH